MHSFSSDTSTKDFKELISFFFNKNEFIRSVKSNLFTKENNIVLTKLLCDGDILDSKTETIVLKNVCSFTTYFDLRKELFGKKDLYYGIELRQINFIKEEEAKAAHKKIMDAGWGDPRHKWNDYQIVAGGKKIFIISTAVAAAQSLRKRYTTILEKEWLPKLKLIN